MRTIDRRSVTSRYHGNSHVSMVPLDVKNLSSQIRTYGSMGCRVVPESNLVQESHTCVYPFLIGHYKTTVCWDPEIFQPWHCDVNRRKFKPSIAILHLFSGWRQQNYASRHNTGDKTLRTIPKVWSWHNCIFLIDSLKSEDPYTLTFSPRALIAFSMSA